MGKDKPDKEKKREKKGKKRSETDGIHKHKKEKKNSSNLSDTVEKELTTKVLDGLEKIEALEKAVNGNTTEIEAKKVESRPVGALVPFANPLAEDKVAKKILKSVKKGKTSRSTHTFLDCSYNFVLVSFLVVNIFIWSPFVTYH